ncbi:MAG: hypothetical protein ACI8QS_000878 [Planctomycetota bacterium]|jgi:hypothetical protein
MRGVSNTSGAQHSRAWVSGTGPFLTLRVSPQDRSCGSFQPHLKPSLIHPTPATGCPSAGPTTRADHRPTQGMFWTNFRRWTPPWFPHHRRPALRRTGGNRRPGEGRASWHSPFLDKPVPELRTNSLLDWPVRSQGRNFAVVFSAVYCARSPPHDRHPGGADQVHRGSASHPAVVRPSARPGKVGARRASRVSVARDPRR